MFKRFLSVVIFVLTVSASAQVKVAILPALDKTGEIKYGLQLMLTASLAEAITNTEGYEAYDRADLSSILDEQNFQRTGMVSENEIHKIGEMTGASYVLITEAAFVDDEHLFASAKIVNVESAKIENSTGVMMNVGTPDLLMNDCKSLTNRLLGIQPEEEKKEIKVEKQLWIEEEHEYVDLGLSVMWATCNIGAMQPEGYGNYFAWGETEIKTSYAWNNYKFRTSGDSYNNVKLSKYKNDGSMGAIDNRSILVSTDDIAHFEWGGNWRIPTKAELDELRTKCTWTWTTRNGVKGYKVTSNIEGFTDRSIFLPATGYRNESNLKEAGVQGYYWTSSLSSKSSGYAWNFFFDSGNKSTTSNMRIFGFPIRPVFSSNSWKKDMSIMLNDKSIYVALGVSNRLKVTAKNGDNTVNYLVTWKTDNPSIATVNEKGEVKGVAVGKATITAYLFDMTASCTVTVDKYVDLGLSVKWAACNIGATNPEELGEYYAWGETNTKSRYDLTNYKFRKKGDEVKNVKFSKYNTIKSRGDVDNNTVLGMSDDVAYVKWGGKWRMPTQEEIDELCNNCTWTWTTINGVDGYKVTSKKVGYTSNYIFLPATSDGYWSSSLYTTSSDKDWNIIGAWMLEITSQKYSGTFVGTRYHGRYVRPVCQ